VPARIRRPVRLTSLYDDLVEAGQVARTTLLQFALRPAQPEVAAALHVAEGTPVQFVERLRFAGDQPIAFMHNYLPADVKGLSQAGLIQSGLYRLIRAAGTELRLATQTIGARVAKRPEARLLAIAPGAALLTMRRIAYDDAGRAVEYGDHVYPAERYAFEMSLVADAGSG